MSEARDFDFVLGPLATAGLLALGWAAGKRSKRAFAVGMGALILENRWSAYQRFKTDPRYSDFNLVMVRGVSRSGLP